MFEDMKIRHLIGVSLLILFLSVIVLFLLPVDLEFAVIALYLVFYIVIPVIFFGHHIRYRGFSIRGVVFTTGVKRWIPSIFGIVLVSILFSLGTFWLFLFVLNPILPSLVDFLLADMPLSDNGWYLTIELLSIMILAPIVEEFIFRGVILHRLMGKTSMWGGILISSLLFGILHASFLGAFLFGIIASLLFIRTGNLLIPILVHMVNNTTAVIWSFVAPTWPDWMLIVEKSDLATKAIPNALMLVVSTVVMVYILLRLSKGTRMRDEVEEEYS